jgi:hypothetical protein
MSVKKLVLFEDIMCGTTDDDGSGLLRVCTSSITRRDMSPKPNAYLSDCEPVQPDTHSAIPAGSYFFVQSYLPDEVPFTESGKPAPALYTAAEELWLEFVWQEKEPDGNTVYVRLLTHEGEFTDNATGQKKSAGLVFQLFRRININKN